MTDLHVIESCDGCGACCETMGWPPFNLDEEAPAILLEEMQCVKAWLEENGIDYDDDGPCYWLDPETKKCIHYEHRPRVCREFELGGEDCTRMVKAKEGK